MCSHEFDSDPAPLAISPCPITSRKPPPPLTNQSGSAQEAGFSGILLAVKLLHIFKHAL